MPVKKKKPMTKAMEAKLRKRKKARTEKAVLRLGEGKSPYAPGKSPKEELWRNELTAASDSLFKMRYGLGPKKKPKKKILKKRVL